MITLTHVEGQSLAVLDAMLGHGRLNTHELTDVVRSPALVKAGATKVRAASIRLLITEGGFREKSFLRGSKRLYGRGWDSDLGAGLKLHFSEATLALWFTSVNLLAFKHTDAREKRPKIQVKPTDANGDWIFYLIAYRSIVALKIGSEDQSQTTEAMRAVSPLVALATLAPHNGYAALCDKSNVRIVECLEVLLGQMMEESLTSAWNQTSNAATSIARWNSISSALNGWVDATIAAKRTDLCRPVMTMFVNVAKKLFSHNPSQAKPRTAREILADNGRVRSVKERDDLIQSFASVIKVAHRLYRMREEMMTINYGEERFAEGQIFIRDATEIMIPSRKILDDVAASLSETIG